MTYSNSGEINIEEGPMDKLETVFELMANTIRKIQAIDYDRKVRTVSVEWVPVESDAAIGKYETMPNVTVVLEKKWFIKKTDDPKQAPSQPHS